MISTESIERLVELSLLSGYIKDGTAPLSLILISQPEAGKTIMLSKFDCPHTIETNDLSAKPISDVVIPKLEKNELHHIIVPDMVKVLAHRNSTVDATMTFLNGLMEEGIKQNLFMGQLFSFKSRLKCGLITAITIDYFYKIFKRWKDIGFTTRFLPVSFNYSQTTINNIHKAIAENQIFSEVIKLKKIQRKTISMPKDIGSWISIKSRELAKEQSNDYIIHQGTDGRRKKIKIEIYGFRLHKQLRKLAMTMALNEKLTYVNWTHIDELEKLIDYIRLPKDAKVI